MPEQIVCVSKVLAMPTAATFLVAGLDHRYPGGIPQINGVIKRIGPAATGVIELIVNAHFAGTHLGLADEAPRFALSAFRT